MTKYLALVLFLSFFGPRASHLKAQERPNVIIIFMDDMGYGDLESYGGFGYETPHTNKLASEGMRFTNFYAAQAVCSASRAGLLTGCYPNRIGLYAALNPSSKIALNPDEETLAEILKAEGYRTSIVGKWHLGDKVPFLPLQQGFDEYFGLPYSNDMWAVDYDGTPVTDPDHRKAWYPPLPLIEGNRVIREIKTLEDQSELTTIYTERACRFIRENSTRPFFLYMAHSMPHVPLAVSDKFAGKSEAGLYGDVMMELDWSIGEIMRTLDELNLNKKTLVVVTSDNGPWLNFGNHAGSTGGLREGKGTSFEGGQREPCIVRWEGKVPAGTISHQLASTIDLLPTIAKICGAALPAKKIDGVDISALWFGQTDVSPRKHFVYYYHKNSLEAIRKDNWKLVFPHVHRTYKKNPPGYDGWPAPQPSDTTELALFDLRTDPGETLDVQNQFPDVVRELTALADQYRRELGDDLTGHKGVARRPAAVVSRD